MYTIGDFLIQVKNSYSAGKKQMAYPHSKVVDSLAKILEKEGYIAKVSILNGDDKQTRKSLELKLKYDGRIPALTSVKLISKPSVHRYVGKGDRKTKTSNGIVILSTSHGLMTGEEAKKKGVGGELICVVS